MYSSFFKRFIDILLSLVALLFLMPIILIISFVIVIGSGFPILFTQERIGRYTQTFKVFKFRTMIIGADKAGPLSTSVGDKRITVVGDFLRRFSLDELPQLLNVLRGDMSLIGYRPGVDNSYSDTFLKTEVFNTRPGITGLAQVSGRSGLTQDKKRELELEYARNITFVGDVKIIFLTVIRVLGARDAY